MKLRDTGTFMKLEEAFSEIEKRPGIEIRDLWPEMLKDAWQAGLLDVQQLLESVELVDLASYSLYFDQVQFEPSFQALSFNIADASEQARTNFRKQLKRSIGKSKFDLIDKLNSISVDRGLSLLDFLVEARASANLASQLQKNATKQGLYEPIAAAYIWHRTGAKPALLAHKETKLQIRFTHAGEFSKSKKAENSLTKSADILVVAKTKKGYVAYLVSHKYARVGGGHQMNQRADAAKFLSFSGKASSARVEIPGLFELCQHLAGDKISRSSFSWEPALILDGDFFRDANTVIKNDPDYPELAKADFFIGDTHDFVEYLSKK